ncbi:hypothetical protein NPIL_171181 [Nephila pilipes]|uniref:Uncharacterized protein n=1 Tax=Nephila pilipes TaxID=299642 RepID=A0A8X6Q696_NEPPI|nr:hypothetical protein NPIL_171181 [Nephila pilipes]
MKGVPHSGVSSTLTQLREKYWIIKGHQSIKSTLSRCNIWKRLNALQGKQSTAPLPPPRVKQSSSFHVTGIDFACTLTSNRPHLKDMNEKDHWCRISDKKNDEMQALASKHEYGFSTTAGTLEHSHWEANWKKNSPGSFYGVLKTNSAEEATTEMGVKHFFKKNCKNGRLVLIVVE